MPRSLKPVLSNKSGTVNDIVSHARYLERLDRRLHSILDSPLKDHVSIANFRKGILVLQVSSPAWAARLRYLIPELKKTLPESLDLQSIRDIRIRIAPEQLNAAMPRTRHRHLSDKAIDTINQAAMTIKDPELKSALSRLARHGKSS
jgi:hypothetical protein